MFSFAGAAHAQVMTVKVVPNAFVGISVKVSVEGGPCGAVNINFGDQNDPVPDNNDTTFTIQTEQLPFHKDHTWHNEGVFTITATGQGNCTGTATAVVKVVKFKPIGPRRDEPLVLAPRPKITGYFGLARPGGVAGIVGTALGSTGTVTATLKKFNGDTLVVPFEKHEDEEITNILEWKPTFIGIRWPDVSGVRAQDATLRVKVGDRTAEWTVAFTPELAFKMLPLDDVKVVSCSMDGNHNVCNNVNASSTCVPIPPISNELSPWPGDASVHGMHSNCPGAIGDDSGTDVYQITLKNDWTLETFDFDKDLTGDDGDYVKSPTPAFPRGAATWKVSIQWLASVDDTVTYNGMIGISGPKGVPHK
jgi:hypothetical protein